MLQKAFDSCIYVCSELSTVFGKNIGSGTQVHIVQEPASKSRTLTDLG